MVLDESLLKAFIAVLLTNACMSNILMLVTNNYHHECEMWGFFMQKMEVGTRILLAALQLMQDKGFKSVTIKDIAQASEVSEMTVFRHFETKKGVLEAAVKKYSFIPSFKKVFEEKIVWDLEQDLHLISKSYLDSMDNNLPIFLIAVQERKTMPDLVGFISKNTKELKAYIAKYFITMQEKKKMVESDAYAQAMTFMIMLYGYFSSTALWGNHYISESREEFIQNSVITFCNGIKK
jgi:TetR/AcrR family transcriptional repressor of mexJK operon